LFGALACAPLLACADAAWLEPQWVKVRHHKFTSGPAACRLAHITDIHHKGDCAYLESVVRKINALSPEAVCFTGDIVEQKRFLPEALAILDRQKDEISAVIIDMMMPVMDGPTAVRAMRWSVPGLKIIATSGLSEMEQSHAGEIKVDRFLQKPYTAEQLLRTLGGLLGKAKG